MCKNLKRMEYIELKKDKNANDYNQLKLYDVTQYEFFNDNRIKILLPMKNKLLNLFSTNVQPIGKKGSNCSKCCGHTSEDKNSFYARWNDLVEKDMSCQIIKYETNYFALKCSNTNNDIKFVEFPLHFLVHTCYKAVYDVFDEKTIPLWPAEEDIKIVENLHKLNHLYTNQVMNNIPMLHLGIYGK